MPKKKKATKAKAAAPKKSAKKSAKKTKRSYTARQRENLLSKYTEYRKSGLTAQQAAKKVGVAYITLRSWEKKAGVGTPGKVAKKAAKKKTAPKKAKKATRKPGRSSAAKTGKKAAKPAAKGGLTLVTPGGFRIEGINSKELIQVLKELR